MAALASAQKGFFELKRLAPSFQWRSDRISKEDSICNSPICKSSIEVHLEFPCYRGLPNFRKDGPSLLPTTLSFPMKNTVVPQGDGSVLFDYIEDPLAELHGAKLFNLELPRRIPPEELEEGAIEDQVLQCFFFVIAQVTEG